MPTTKKNPVEQPPILDDEDEEILDSIWDRFRDDLALLEIREQIYRDRDSEQPG